MYGSTNRQFNTKEPVDVVVFARDAENIRGSLDLKYTTFSSSHYSSRQSNAMEDIPSIRQDEFSSKQSIIPFSNGSKEDVNITSKQYVFQHYSPKKLLEANSKHLYPRRFPYDEGNITQNHFKPIQPVSTRNGNHSSREGFRGFNSDVEEKSRYGNKRVIQYNSDPYLPNFHEKYSSNQSVNQSSPRSTKMDNTTMKRVRLAIPNYSEPDLNVVSDPPNRVFYEDLGDESSLQVHMSEIERKDERKRLDSNSLQFEMSPRRRPTGFGGRLLPQVPELSVMESDNENSHFYHQSSSRQESNYRQKTEQISKNNRTVNPFDRDDNSENQSPSRTTSNPPTYLKRRRTAVFGLSPTSGLNIGAVM